MVLVEVSCPRVHKEGNSTFAWLLAEQSVKEQNSQQQLMKYLMFAAVRVHKPTHPNPVAVQVESGLHLTSITPLSP